MAAPDKAGLRELKLPSNSDRVFKSGKAAGIPGACERLRRSAARTPSEFQRACLHLKNPRQHSPKTAQEKHCTTANSLPRWCSRKIRAWLWTLSAALRAFDSARYAGPNATDADRNRKLLDAMRGKSGEDRRARFVCVTTIARQGQAIAIFSDFAAGRHIRRAPRRRRIRIRPRFFASGA